MQRIRLHRFAVTLTLSFLAGLMGWVPAADDTGLPQGPYTDTTTLKTVAQFDVAEFSFTVPADSLQGRNPYRACTPVLSISTPATDTKPRTSVRQVDGFYAGNNRYCLRWLADLPPGTYEYRLGLTGYRPSHFKDALVNEISATVGTGQFTIAGESTAQTNGPLKVSKVNPIWFADREDKPVYFCGVWSHSSLDISQMIGKGYSGWDSCTPEQFNMYFDEPVKAGYLEKDGRPTQKYFDEIDKLCADLAAHRTQMVCITADHMGWGFQSASNWKGKRHGEFSDPFAYDPHAGLTWDYFLNAARKNGIYVKINLMEFCQNRYAEHPWNTIEGVDLKRKREKIDDVLNNQTARASWAAWVNYLTLRYGAFDNVHFQMGNEPPGDWFERPEDEWKAMDRETMQLVKFNTGDHALYSSGALVGVKPLLQADYDVEHANPRKLGGASCFIYKRFRDLPFHIEEIEAYNGGNKELWLKSCRYEKFACFAQGFYASALVMWNWKKTDDALDKYYDSTLALMAFVDPVREKLFDFKPDNTVIAQAPGEVALALCSKKDLMVYLQKDDPKIERKPEDGPLPTTLRLQHLTGKAATAHWFDPSAGKFLEPAIAVVIADGQAEFTPPAVYTDDIALRVTVD